MQTRLSKVNWFVMCVGMFLMAGPAVPAQAGNWFRSKNADNCPEDADCDDECPEDGASCPRERRLCRWCQGRGCQHCQSRGCRWCQGRGCQCCLGGGGWNGGGWYKPLNGYYCDPRDTRLYSAQGYNVPVTVPLAPVVRGSFNYGWGIPSARLSQAGGYAAWRPDQPFSQTGGRLPGGIYPVIYQPTDTTQLGYFYNYVPAWQARRW
jgi:hypothetical protein